jgi:diadenosine tetraphosphate (Ap4A) HIT family hydrolase
MTRRSDSYAAEAEDEDVVVLSSPGLAGLVVMPRRHVSGLEELPPQQRARLLAALRRVSLSIGEEYHGSAPRVVVTTDPPASEGHVCFQFVPGNRKTGV